MAARHCPKYDRRLALFTHLLRCFLEYLATPTQTGIPIPFGSFLGDRTLYKTCPAIHQRRANGDSYRTERGIIPLSPPREKGWLRQQQKVAKPPKRRRRREAQAR